ncbi:MAG: hypothetical protein IJZ85_13190 [Lachnospiraceae bacterium]|nr:hypothetical protein [Lachnospiraceae bacterium]
MAMDSLTIIKNAKEVLAALEAAKAEEQSFDLEAKQLKKRLDAEKQMVSDTIRQTVTERREEIEENYRKETAKVQERQKKVRAERSKAKAAGVKTRIQDETADLWEENRRLKKELSVRVRQNKIPAFCNTFYYFALYFTRGWLEALVLLLTFLLAFLVIPCGIYYLIPERRALYLVFIYIAAVVIFFGLYIGIGNYTKDRYIATLKECRKIRDVISANRRRIRTITRSIEKDRDEQLYQLEDFDERLGRLAGELQDIENRKMAALKQFDNVTVKMIKQEIEGNSQEQMDSLNAGIAAAKAQLEKRQECIRALNLKLTDEYIPYLGKEFMEPKALTGLEQILADGAAANLTEAKQLYIEQHSST